MTKLQWAPRKTLKVSSQMEHSAYKRQLTQVADADGLFSKVHNESKRYDGHK